MGNRKHQVSEDEARDELARILSDHRFHVSERNRAFLRFVADAVFEGRTETIKAYSIAVDVFGRPSTFDAGADPIVRIEATRLRSALAQYYEAFGEEGVVRIAIPKGRYVPIFTRSPVPCPDPEEQDEIVGEPRMQPPQKAAAPPGTSAAAMSRRPRLALASAAALIAIAIATLFVSWTMSGSSVFTRKPMVTLMLSQSDDMPTFGADAVIDGLMIALASYGTLRLKPTDGFASALDGSVSAATSSSAGSNEINNSYAISLRYAEDGSAASIIWQVVDSATNEVAGNGQDVVPLAGLTIKEAREQLVDQLARKIAGSHGLINTLETHRNLPEWTTGNTCVLRAEFAVDQHDLPGLATAKACLEASLRAEPSDADVNSALSLVLVSMQRSKGVLGTDSDDLERALFLANKAAAISPNSGRAGIALMVALYHTGRIEAALATGRRIMPLNPDNADIPAKLGLFSFLSGQFDTASALAVRAKEIGGVPPRDATLVLMMKAYREQRFADVLFLAQELPSSDALSDMVRLAAIGRLGDPGAIAREWQVTTARYPDFGRTISAALSSRLCDKAVSDDIRKGLSSAGLKVSP
jgi:tetratricopeptide (TPR) repeat protein